MTPTSDSLFCYDRCLNCRYVCGADETGHGAWAGPLVIAAVRFDYDRLMTDTDAVARLEHLNDSKQVTARRRAGLLPAIFEVAESVAVVVVSAAQIDEEGLDVANLRALGSALEAVAADGSANLVDCFDLKAAGVSTRPVPHGDETSAAIAAASVVAKEVRDQLMRGLDTEYPGSGSRHTRGTAPPRMTRRVVS